ncbi:MAG: carboxypeptidase regulatory-like domain-containing protein [Candidatus Eremiobacteraeota bacterium]|nr:carboxypeptidase regulatory-like domain-containing protein [Candidatus Eremiobacteraeota bacterium]MBV8283559.1 carboxypeptidase regulatory-like domain-containing protein [Candidatus Eremiobacteraeota bacterium]
MRTFAVLLAFVSLLAAPVLADTNTAGLSGTVVDAKTGQPIAHATILYYRTPYLENGTNRIYTVKTDNKGFFSDITLEPGRYVVMARVPDRVIGCAVDDVQIGEVARVKMVVGRDQIVCSGPRVHPTSVDPNLTADLYRI